MLMDTYAPYFFNANVNEASGSAVAYRGELIVKEGEIADAQGRRKPPVEVMKQVIVLTEGDNLKFMTGSLDELQFVNALVDKYGKDFQASTLAIFFVVNIDNPFMAPINGVPAAFIPLVQGMTWNELIDMVALEKGDFKGQSAAEKVVTLFDAFKGYNFKFPTSSLEVELTKTNSNKRENHGAI